MRLIIKIVNLIYEFFDIQQKSNIIVSGVICPLLEILSLFMALGGHESLPEKMLSDLGATLVRITGISNHHRTLFGSSSVFLTSLLSMMFCVQKCTSSFKCCIKLITVWFRHDELSGRCFGTKDFCELYENFLFLAPAFPKLPSSTLGLIIKATEAEISSGSCQSAVQVWLQCFLSGGPHCLCYFCGDLYLKIKTSEENSEGRRKGFRCRLVARHVCLGGARLSFQTIIAISVIQKEITSLRWDQLVYSN